MKETDTPEPARCVLNGDALCGECSARGARCDVVTDEDAVNYRDAARWTADGSHEDPDDDTEHLDDIDLPNLYVRPVHVEVWTPHGLLMWDQHDGFTGDREAVNAARRAVSESPGPMSVADVILSLVDDDESVAIPAILFAVDAVTTPRAV